MSVKLLKYEAGQEYVRWTPFIKEDRDVFDGKGVSTIKSWRPGVRYEPIAPDDSEPVWDGDGVETRRIVAVTQVDGGGVRILYRRSYRTPDGSVFGKRTVRMTTPSGFTSWVRGSSCGLRLQLRCRERNPLEAEGLSPWVR